MMRLLGLLVWALRVWLVSDSLAMLAVLQSLGLERTPAYAAELAHLQRLRG